MPTDCECERECECEYENGGTYAQLLRDRAHAPPVNERVEDELIAA